MSSFALDCPVSHFLESNRGWMLAPFTRMSRPRRVSPGALVSHFGCTSCRNRVHSSHPRNSIHSPLMRFRVMRSILRFIATGTLLAFALPLLADDAKTPPPPKEKLVSAGELSGKLTKNKDGNLS